MGRGSTTFARCRVLNPSRACPFLFLQCYKAASATLDWRRESLRKCHASQPEPKSSPTCYCFSSPGGWLKSFHGWPSPKETKTHAAHLGLNKLCAIPGCHNRYQNTYLTRGHFLGLVSYKSTYYFLNMSRKCGISSWLRTYIGTQINSAVLGSCLWEEALFWGAGLALGLCES